MEEDNEKSFISLRVGLAKISENLLSPVFKMYHLFLNFQKCLNTHVDYEFVSFENR